MRLRNMLKICLVFWDSEPQYAYKRYAYKKNMYFIRTNTHFKSCFNLHEIDIIPPHDYKDHQNIKH